MAKILLNESTEIEVKETKAQIRSKIRQEIRGEKYKKENQAPIDHFIEVTMINSTAMEIKDKKEILTDLYYKRILYIYD